MGDAYENGEDDDMIPRRLPCPSAEVNQERPTTYLLMISTR